ncbi:hypothetical protein [Methylopila sp. 73B]|uniref:hypothetical protein n=1 Tax=Methylopila sp. 73B TaxID=1120792 RepID=UPI0012DC41B8|nr:hypothetical protein [Methylopila sp. 73B]
MTELFAEVRRTIELVAEIQTAATLSVVGLALMAFASAALYWAINRAGEAATWLKLTMAASLVSGVAFSIAGPAVALLSRTDTPIRTLPKDQIFAKLRTNERVTWLIRLIPYYPDKQPELAVSQLRTLGPSSLKYVFVGSYEEVKGRTVEQAIAMVGGAYHRDQRVSAVIFAVSGRYPIFPGNARGLLQVIKKIETDPASQVANKLIKEDALGKDAEESLLNEELSSWSFDFYKKYFWKFCSLTHKLRCGKAAFDVHQSISSINSDWHPAGAATMRQSDPCASAPRVCTFTTWDEITNDIYPDFGARVFLIENKPITDLSNRYLIDFENPSMQLIPEIGNVATARGG